MRGPNHHSFCRKKPVPLDSICFLNHLKKPVDKKRNRHNLFELPKILWQVSQQKAAITECKGKNHQGLEGGYEREPKRRNAMLIFNMTHRCVNRIRVILNVL